MAENYALVQKGFRILHPLLADYIIQEMIREYKDDWRHEVLTTLSDQLRDMQDKADDPHLKEFLDMANCLRLFDRKWNDLFRKKLSLDYRTWAKELMGVRNRLAHLGSEDFTENDTWRALDTLSRLCEQIDPHGSEEIRVLLRQSRYGSADGSCNIVKAVPASAQKTDKSEKSVNCGIKGLPSWREVIEPHPDVAQGRFNNAEFAADLAQVARGEGAYEYRDPVEFFDRTYLTEGMTGLLVHALKRVNGKDGEPVVQLKTAFGGGKTHSMLALYHLMRGRISVDKIPTIKPLLEQAGVATLPKTNVAVLVGTTLNPTKSRRPQNFPGITINTLWGEIAAQLAESAGNASLYDYVKEADKKGVSPGSEVLKNLFDAAAPCMVLMDELVAYAKKLYGVNDLPAGSFDNFITFIQEITEAARASKNSLVVASIPESDIEIGGDAGKQALEVIEHTFGRMESIWKPVAANEGFEVVRRRLFLDCKNPAARDLVCGKFSQMYNENSSDFPVECRAVEYRERMISCYPIHPEVFDRLYEDWATLERFQRTRGVLRLMAAVIHELWMRNDASTMIMPGSLSMDVPNVRDELTRHLPEGWNAIVDREVDGKKAIPYQQDQSNQRYGIMLASRRVARTIMLGSAPTDRSQSVRGIGASRIRLGVAQPGESIAVFNDALNTLPTSLAYLYATPSNDRFWYDTRPTLRKTVEDRATQISATDMECEIERRLRTLRKENPFGGIHICPGTSLDVPDDQTVRLVIICPKDGYKASVPKNQAITAAEDILNNRGTSPRIYRNMLAFIAPDHELMKSLNQEVRRYLAWLSIKNDSADLNLDAAQNRETDNNIKRSNETVELRIKESFCWLLVPYIDRSVDMKSVVWDTIRISGGTDHIVSKAAKKMIQNGLLITQWAPSLLLLELDKVLWKESDSIDVKKLWDYLCTYCYLPRLANYKVLEEAIRNGINSTEYFALAAGRSDKRFLDLKYNQYVGIIANSDILVKLDLAQKQIAEETSAQTDTVSSSLRSETGLNKQQGKGLRTEAGSLPADSVSSVPTDDASPQQDRPQNRHFSMMATLDNTRIMRDVKKLVEEVISHLTTVDGVTVNISLDVEANAPNGLSTSTVRTVSENCQTLKVSNFEFNE
ncbi:MAG: DUF499 domain-containing protein [Thermoguttaceae bacterium]|nr:DUF499 domain-containing protein [Thermoguttaceae bacterium]